MADTIPNLWPEGIKVDVLTPLTILRAQAGTLSRITKGILEADVKVEQSDDEKGSSTTQIHFDLIAPALNRAGYRILTARYQNGMAYPTSIQSEYFDVSRMLGNSSASFNHNLPANEDEFLRAVSNILQSRKLMSLVQSLIARSNEQLLSTRRATDEPV